METISDYVDRHGMALPVLPVLHCCDSAGFRDIITSGKLACSPCPVFDNELLSYFFYGSAAYRPNPKSSPSTHPAFNPIVLVFDIETLGPINRVFPFDTGAFEAGLYDRALYRRQPRTSESSGMKIDDFSLTPDWQTPSKTIEAFFDGGTAQYLEGHGGRIDPESIGPMDHELHSMSIILGQQGTTEHDERAYTIEVQLDHEIDFSNAKVKAVACPAVYLDDYDIRTTLDDWNATLLPYSYRAGSPLERMAFVKSMVHTHITKEWLSGNFAK